MYYAHRDARRVESGIIHYSFSRNLSRLYPGLLQSPLNSVGDLTTLSP